MRLVVSQDDRLSSVCPEDSDLEVADGARTSGGEPAITDGGQEPIEVPGATETVTSSLELKNPWVP